MQQCDELKVKSLFGRGLRRIQKSCLGTHITGTLAREFDFKKDLIRKNESIFVPFLLFSCVSIAWDYVREE